MNKLNINIRLTLNPIPRSYLPRSPPAALSNGHASKMTTCSCTTCPNKGSGEIQKLFYCSVCHKDQYCSKECQKKCWIVEGHKYCCVKNGEPRHFVFPKDGIDDIKEKILGADSGDVIDLSKGSYHFRNDDGSDATLIM